MYVNQKSGKRNKIRLNEKWYSVRNQMKKINQEVVWWSKKYETKRPIKRWQDGI